MKDMRSADRIMRVRAIRAALPEVSVSELALAFFVREETIREDLGLTLSPELVEFSRALKTKPRFRVRALQVARA